MKNKIIALALGVLVAMPCVLRAEEIEIQLSEVIQMGQMAPIGGDSPLDDAEHMGSTPTRPNDFCATIDGNSLSITKLNEAIPFAQATVINATNGGIVINQQFTYSLQEQISNTGAYVLHIQTEGGALVGQFVVQ